MPLLLQQHGAFACFPSQDPEGMSERIAALGGRGGRFVQPRGSGDSPCFGRRNQERAGKQCWGKGMHFTAAAGWCFCLQHRLRAARSFWSGPRPLDPYLGAAAQRGARGKAGILAGSLVGGSSVPACLPACLRGMQATTREGISITVNKAVSHPHSLFLVGKSVGIS